LVILTICQQKIGSHFGGRDTLAERDCFWTRPSEQEEAAINVFCLQIHENCCLAANQGDQIWRNFAHWAKFFSFG
jgi:hypothetical protein